MGIGLWITTDRLGQGIFFVGGGGGGGGGGAACATCLYESIHIIV